MHPSTIGFFEDATKIATFPTRAKLRAALEAAGAEFMRDGGVRLREWSAMTSRIKNRERAIRGDMNAILNGMITSGVIRSFDTNFDSPASSGLAVHVMVTADGVTTDHARRALRDRITKALAHLDPDVVVSVRPAKEP